MPPAVVGAGAGQRAGPSAGGLRAPALRGGAPGGGTAGAGALRGPVPAAGAAGRGRHGRRLQRV
ncbi:hypothetical protein D7W79_27700 [Corallococcus exercitus]|nr:hypothetical protein D7W79_27700 [Corallococcus exercitus]